MKILIMLAAAMLCLNLEARRSYSSCGRPKTVSVRGYVTRRGTYVQPHRRAAPVRNGTFSFRGGGSKRMTHISSVVGLYGGNSNSGTEDAMVDKSRIDYSRRCSVCCGSGKRYRSITGASRINSRETSTCIACQGTGFRLRK